MTQLSPTLRLYLFACALALIARPAVACDFDGSNHGGFGPWAAFTARHKSMPIEVPDEPLSRRVRIAEAIAQREEAEENRTDTALTAEGPDATTKPLRQALP